MAEGQSSQRMRVAVAWYHEHEWEELRRLSESRVSRVGPDFFRK